jgi:hypothetical protein
MIKHYSPVPFLVAAVVILAACGSPSSSGDATTAGVAKAPQQTEVVMHGDYPSYSSVDALFDTADLVLRGRVIGQPRVVVVEPASPGRQDAIVYTVRRVQVTEVFKGATSKNSVIEVKQLGGLVDGVTYKEDDAKPLRAEREYTLFLASFDDSPASLLNPMQAQFEVDGALLRPAPGNNLKLTRTQLVKLGAQGQ